MYARAKIGGFLHLSIGEEATIVGSARALRDSDYLISTYRSHGHALVRGTPPENVMAELFGRVDGCSRRPRRLDAHVRPRAPLHGRLRDRRRQPADRRRASRSPRDYQGTEDVTLCTFGDGASNQGTFGETLNLAALWKLPVVFMVTNNQFGMGTSLQRHSAVTDLQRKGESLGVPGMRCDGMDVLDTHAVVAEALRARARGAPAAARRGRHLPLPRPLDGRPRAVPHQGGGRAVARARPDPRLRRAARSARACSTERSASRSTREAIARVDAAVRVRRRLAVPGARVAVRRRVRARRPGPAAGTRCARPTRARRRRRADRVRERRRDDEIPQQMTDALARTRRGRRSPDGRDALPRGARTRRCARSCAATSACC